MRILITKQQPLTAPGGETSHLFGVAGEMRKMGAEIFMMPVTKTPTPPALWPPEYVRDVPPFGFHHLFDSFRLSHSAANFLRSHPVDVVLSWQYESAYLRTFTRSRKFVLGVIAGAPFSWLKGMAQQNPVRALAYHFFHFRQLRQAEVIFCPSKFAKTELVQVLGLDPQKIVVTPLAANDVFQPAPKPKASSLRTIIFLGYLEPIKGIFDAIEALGLVSKQGAGDWIFKIAGWGDRDAVRAEARAVGIESQLHFLGKLDHPALAAELASADLALLPSHTETFGLSIAEAQACGLPVVSYAVGGIPEIVIPNETALLAPPFDRAALANAILRLLNDPELAHRMGQRGAENIRANFSWERAARLMINRLEQMLL